MRRSVTEAVPPFLPHGSGGGGGRRPLSQQLSPRHARHKQRLQNRRETGPHFQPTDTVDQKQKLSWQACAELEQSCYEEQNLKAPHSKESCAKGLLRDEPDAHANDATWQSAPSHTQKLELLEGCANLNAGIGGDWSVVEREKKINK